MDEIENELEKLIAEAEAEKNTGDNNDSDPINNAGNDELPKTQDIITVNTNQETIAKEGQPAGNENQQVQSTDPVVVDVNGIELKFNTKEELATYFKNTTSNKPDLLDSNGISKEDLLLLKDLKAGNISAIKKLVTDAKVDLLDVEEFSGDYTPASSLVEYSELDIAAFEVQKDVELSNELARIVPSLPKEFIDVVGTNVNDYRAFTKQVKDGLAQPVIAEALKLTHTVGGSFLEHYNAVGAKMYAGQQQQSQAPQQKQIPATQQRQVNPREQELRAKAGAGGGGDNTSKKASDLSVDDIWNMSASELMDMDFRDAE